MPICGLLMKLVTKLFQSQSTNLYKPVSGRKLWVALIKS
jgi:hypothetical protein